MTMTAATTHSTPPPLGFAHLYSTSWRRSSSVVRNKRLQNVAASRKSDNRVGVTFKWKSAFERGTSQWALRQQRQDDDDDHDIVEIDTITANIAPTVLTTPTATTTVKSQAALIAGTAIGGGFLALPAATAPCGAGPSVLGLCGVWLFLLGGSLSLSNAIFGMKRRRSRSTKMLNAHHMPNQLDDGQDDDASPPFTPSLSSLIRECYGNTAGLITGLAFLSLIMLTLVAQLSKVGSLLGNAFPQINVNLSTTCFTVSMVALCSLCNGRRVERINTVLTSVMLTSFVTLVGLAAGSGSWSLDALKRADYRLLLPSLFSPSTSSSMGLSSPWAVPIFIQLLVYNEVVPLVASRLKDEAKVRQAILLGSSVPLLMCLVWSCVSLGLVPYEPPSVTAAISGSMYSYDPLNKLLGASSMGGIIGKIFPLSVNVLAGSAICTTIIGCILASAQFIEDVMHRRTKSTKRSNDGDKATTRENVYRKVGTRALAIVPSAMIALYGTNRDLYYRALRLAGAGPVTLLYGLLPPLCNLRLCWKHGSTDNGKNGSTGSTIRRRIHVVTQMMLVMISAGILTASHISK